jgi:hypothetical protein
MSPNEDSYPRVNLIERARFRQAQAYEDAIAYRRARLTAPCPACGPARCDAHAADAALIRAYQRAATRSGAHTSG